MMKLKVEARDTATSPEQIRGAGKIPGICYGHGQDSIAFSVDAASFEMFYKKAGTSTIISLEGLAEERDTLVKEVAYHSVTGKILHIDLYAITKGETIETEVPLVLVGESPAVKAGASIIHVIQDLLIEAMPQNLPHEITVDISVLVNEGDVITVGELVLPEGVTALVDADEPVVIASEAQEESEDPVVPIDMSAIEVEKKGKKPEDAAAAE